MKIKCLIVDDEPAAQDILKRFINDDPRLEIVDICSNAFDANRVISENPVDLLFLDINMPRLSGIAFYKALSNPPAVIFTTAYNEYAVEGFDLDAVDYLLKPFDFERFYKAVSKAVEKTKASKHGNPGFILLHADKKIYKTNLKNILYLEAQGDYVNVCLEKGYLLVHDTLTNMLNRLPDDQFFQIHKSYVIALDRFDFIEGNMVTIKNKNLPIGKTYRETFIKKVKQGTP